MPTVSQSLRNRVIAKRGRICLYCGRGPLYRRALHLDHVVPQSHGGKNEVSNLVPACNTCNHRKSNKDISVYVVERMEQLTLEMQVLEFLSKKFPLCASRGGL